MTGVKLAAYAFLKPFFTFLTPGSSNRGFREFSFHPLRRPCRDAAAVSSLFEAYDARLLAGVGRPVLRGGLFCVNLTLPYGVEFLLEFEGPVHRGHHLRPRIRGLLPGVRLRVRHPLRAAPWP